MQPFLFRVEFLYVLLDLFHRIPELNHPNPLWASRPAAVIQFFRFLRGKPHERGQQTAGAAMV